MTLTSFWREIVVAKTAGSYEERICLRCFEGRVYEILSVVRGWLVSGALAVGGWWFTSTPR
jgi:hypothetical protein